MLPRKSVLITDLDNTLFNWVQLWHDCFTAMMDKVVEISGVPFDELKPEIRAVHQRHGTSEYSFLIEEIPMLRKKYRNERLADVFQPAFEAYRTTRRQQLRLYPTVGETLLKIKGSGAAIVGYTESMGFYSNYRIRRLGLDGVLDYVFSPEDHDIPEGITRDEIRKYPASHYEFRYTVHKHTPKGSLKPDPSVLLSIIGDLKADRADCVYIGDSPTRDVAMAQDAGVADVYARYGRVQHLAMYDLLRDVTHWTDERVEHEKKVDERSVNASLTFENNFGEILDHFKFEDWRGREPIGVIGADSEKRTAVIDVWKKAVDVQMHFNEIEMKIRGLFVTIILGLAAAQGFLLDKQLSFEIGPVKVLYATFIPLVGIFAACLFYFMDRYWYHRLLLGAVKQGSDIEKMYARELPELALTKRIGETSPVDLKKEWKGRTGTVVKRIAGWFVSDSKFMDSQRLHSDAKIELFYKSIGALLLLAFAATALFIGVLVADKSIATHVVQSVSKGISRHWHRAFHPEPPAAPLPRVEPQQTPPPKLPEPPSDKGRK